MDWNGPCITNRVTIIFQMEAFYHKSLTPEPSQRKWSSALSVPSDFGNLTHTYWPLRPCCCSFYVPCVVMLGIYCRLYCYAQKHVKSIRAVTPVAGSSPGCVVGGAGMAHAPHLQQSYRVSDHKAAITVGVIMGVFLVCWVPFFCVNIVAAYCKTCIPDIAFKVSLCDSLYFVYPILLRMFVSCCRRNVWSSLAVSFC